MAKKLEVEEKEFDWSDGTDLVVKSVDAIAVYHNREFDVVIRQQNTHGEDAFVIVPRDKLEELIAVLQNEVQY